MQQEEPVKKLAIAMLCVLATTPALAQSVGEKAKSASEESGVSSLVGATPPTANFITDAAISDMFEIQSSQMAATRADPATQTFAKQMVQDHQKTSQELKAMIDSGKVKAVLPPAMDKKHQDMLDKLQSEKGNDFTKIYHSDQVSAHKTAVSLFERYAKGGDDPALKAWAAQTLPALQHHLDMAKALDK
jgi:putative membrane protein